MDSQHHTDTAHEITDVIRQAQNALQARFHDLITPHNLTIPQFNVLQHLHWHDDEGGLGISVLSEHIGLANSTTSGIIDRLERDGWVTRVRGEMDQREVWVQIKDKGRNLFKRIPVDVEEFWKTTIGRLSAKDQVELVNSLRKLKQVMEQPKGPSNEKIHEGRRKGLEAEVRSGTHRNLEEILSDTLQEIGLLLVLARETDEKGNFEGTAYLRQIATEQTAHAFRMARILGYVDNVGARLRELIDTKTVSTAVKEKAMEVAREERFGQMVAFFEHMREEDRKYQRILENVLFLLESKT